MNAPAGSVAEIPQVTVRQARQDQVRTHRRVVELVEGRLGADPEEFLLRLSATFRIAPITLDEMRLCEPVLDVVPFAEAAKRLCFVLRPPDGPLIAVLGDPFDSQAQDWLEERLAVPFVYRVAHRLDVVASLSQQEERLRAMDDVVSSMPAQSGQQESAQDISLETISETPSTVVKLVSSTLYDALKSGASDIHLETGPSRLTIKYRIDGVLTTAQTLSAIALADQVVSRIKVMSELDIAERRVPQDGRFKVKSDGRDIDLRVSVMPSVFGEDVVLRILDKRSLSDELKGLTLDQLGFAPAAIKTLRRLSSEPYGMVLVTGPTGSGKTTTLYAAISEVNKGIDKIITIEDPVEYQLPGVLQIPVNEKKGLTFARGLRSILRHDPDRIMVGEIRDPETAEIAVQSALTGHLVYTTVHANNVFDVIGRFMHMGVDAYNFVSALNAVLAQRLVRVNCRACLTTYRPADALLEESGIALPTAAGISFRRGRGCATCRGSGFKGRKAIGELLVMNDDLRELIVGRAPARELKAAALKAGTTRLREAALALVNAGETTLEEVNRVTFVA